MMKKIIFITGTRADYGKLKTLMKRVDADERYEAYIYVSGMHLLEKYGNTYKEILKEQYKNVYLAHGQIYTQSMSYNIGNVICNMTGYVRSVKPDMIVVHGDRIDALAGAIVGALNNIMVAHIEGGEISGTIDESIRHAITKFAHLHLVSNEEARKRLLQMGELDERIFVIGSPDIDVMLSSKLPSLDEVKEYYQIPFDQYAIFMYHPVTTEAQLLRTKIREVISAIKKSEKRYVIIYPNNDMGTETIIEQIKDLDDTNKFRIFPSIRFEYFLTMLKNAEFIIGNSSAGVREAGIYGVPTIDIGTRQKGRYILEKNKNIQWTTENEDDILCAIDRIASCKFPTNFFGDGNSTDMFMKVLADENLWNNPIQKRFIDYSLDF